MQVQNASRLPPKATSPTAQALCSDPESDVYRRLYEQFGYGCEPDGTFIPAFCDEKKYSQTWGWGTWMNWYGIECVPIYVHLR